MTSMQVCRTIAELRAALPALPRPLGMVPTMGALHRGHLALARTSVAENRATVASIFVNPAQFGPQEDLARYPRELPRDLALLERAGVALVFAPAPEEMYPPGYATWVEVAGPPAERLEAERRPGHFRGVTTVVTKLLLLVLPDIAYFGQKDAQQLAVVRRLVADLNIPVQTRAVPTVREPDGLALSSRNVYLSPPERAAATALARALARAQECYREGSRSPEAVRAAMLAALSAEPLATPDYADLADPDTFQPAATLRDSTLALIACRIGSTRLIDNAALGGPAPLPREGGVKSK